MSNTPNFVLIFTDQQRADTLACYGNVFTETGGVDRIAAEGARFTHAFTPWPVCTPARASVWTGTYPHKHGVIDNVYDIDNAFQSVSRITRTIFDVLKAGGYHTTHIGKWHLGEKQPPFFDDYIVSFNSRMPHWTGGHEGEYRPTVQTDRCIDFLRERKDNDQPFICVQGYYPPHNPFTAPKQFYEPYRGKGVPFAGYYAAVSALAEDTGRILDVLDETGLADNTVVIYFSDHGETFRYRQDGEHKFVCHDDSIHVPLLIRWPGWIKPGTVIDQPVSLLDLMPTILEMADLGVPDGLHGRSLLPLLNGNAAGWRDSTYVETITFRRQMEQRCLRTDRWKLIADAGSEHEFYDLDWDPEEEWNVFVTPRSDPVGMFKHVRSYAAEIAAMAKRMRDRATPLADARGVELADMVLAAVKDRLPQPAS